VLGERRMGLDAVAAAVVRPLRRAVSALVALKAERSEVARIVGAVLSDQ
jgi:hypothetical protein